MEYFQTLKNLGHPWNCTDARRIEAHYRDHEVDWTVVSEWFANALALLPALKGTEPSPYSDEDLKYISYCIDAFIELHPSIQLLNDHAFRAWLQYEGRSHPTDEQVRWLGKTILPAVLHRQVESVFALVERFPNVDNTEWLTSAARTQLRAHAENANYCVWLVGGVFSALGEKSEAFLREAVIASPSAAIAAYGRDLLSLIARKTL